MSRARWPVAALVLWSVYVWTTRIVNTVTGDEAGWMTSVTLSLSVIGLAGAAGVVLVRARSRALTVVEARIWQALAVWTVLVWLVRGVEIAVSDHEIGFKVVHIVLGVVSIALAAATGRLATREAAAAGGVSPLVGADR
jgi:hypothetical protein